MTGNEKINIATVDDCQLNTDNRITKLELRKGLLVVSDNRLRSGEAMWRTQIDELTSVQH